MDGCIAQAGAACGIGVWSLGFRGFQQKGCLTQAGAAIEFRELEIWGFRVFGEVVSLDWTPLAG